MPIVETEVEKPAVQGSTMEITVSRQLTGEGTHRDTERGGAQNHHPILSNFLIEAEGDRSASPPPTLTGHPHQAAVKVKKPAPAPFLPASFTTTSSCSPMATSALNCWITTGCRSRSGRSNTKMVGMARANYSAGA